MLLKEEIKWRTDSKLEKQTLMDNMDFLENISGAVKMASSDLMEHSPFTCLIHYFFIASKIFVALVIVSNRLNTCRSWISSQLLRKYQKHSGWRYSPEEIWSTLKISNCDRICRNLKPSTERFGASKSLEPVTLTLRAPHSVLMRKISAFVLNPYKPEDEGNHFQKLRGPTESQC